MTSDATKRRDDAAYEQFRTQWLESIEADNPSSVEKGHRFATKLITEWLNVTEDDDDLILCDGSGDGGIDIAYLQVAEESANDSTNDEEEGSVWYVIQSKYGTALQGQQTVITEGRKVISTLAGENTGKLSDDTRKLIDRIGEFRRKSGERDQLTLVFATDDPLNEEERKALEDVRRIGNDRFPNLFDVEDISIRTIWEKTQEADLGDVVVPLKATLGNPDENLRVGTIRLRALYDFLKAYDRQTGNLDLLYDRNVRQYLGGRTRINKRIKSTLENEPEMFGLYNNGITIIAETIERGKKRQFELRRPYVVNGCQTTRTIWDVLRTKLDHGATGKGPKDEWEERLDRSFVVVKIVTGAGSSVTDEITKYTNSQTAVRAQDFISLEEAYRNWKTRFEEEFGVFLETQRGGWDAQKARQKSRRSQDTFSESANAFELIKVIAAGWYDMPGAAFRTNILFLSTGAGYAKVTEKDTNPEGFDHRNLYAAYLLRKQADRLGFGRQAKQQRRLTRFLFYMVTVSMLRSIMRENNPSLSPREVSEAIVSLGKSSTGELEALADNAAQLVDEYMTQGEEQGAFNEEIYRIRFGENLNQFLKSDTLGQAESTPLLHQKLAVYQVVAKMSQQGMPSLSERVLSAV